MFKSLIYLSQIWIVTLTGDLAKLAGPTVFGLRRWHRERERMATMFCQLAQDRRSRAAPSKQYIPPRIKTVLQSYVPNYFKIKKYTNNWKVDELITRCIETR